MSVLTELQAVVAVAHQRSFRKAATELGLSPSALSHAIATLEQRMGVRLFHRTTRSVALTEAGEQFLRRIAPALGAIDEAMAGINEFRDTPAGTLRINSSEGAARLILLPVILEFLQRYPDMQLDLVTEGKLVDVVAEGFDAGIRSADNVPLDMIAVPCSPPIRFVVAASPDYLQQHGIPQNPDDLKHHNCIRSRLPSGTLYPWQFQRGNDKVQIQPKGGLTLDNANLMLDAAIAGAGLIWTSQWQVAKAISKGELKIVLLDWSFEEPALCLYYPGHRHIPAGLKAFISLLREKAAHKAGFD